MEVNILMKGLNFFYAILKTELCFYFLKIKTLNFIIDSTPTIP